VEYRHLFDDEPGQRAREEIRERKRRTVANMSDDEVSAALFG
jgi:hypothetical protein